MSFFLGTISKLQSVVIESVSSTANVTYFAMTEIDGMASPKLGLLILLWTGEPEIRRLAASSFNMALLPTLACDTVQADQALLRRCQVWHTQLPLLPRFDAEYPRSIYC